ncbi:hypothetical protein ACFVWG_02825 [Kribbella sp. NPDC058245]|uniref:hypothetical protein n=1 Tax=Kribbella sp. NPDC058245 TaxID=3346399 RepID=UPI0036E398FB
MGRISAASALFSAQLHFRRVSRAPADRLSTDWDQPPAWDAWTDAEQLVTRRFGRRSSTAPAREVSGTTYPLT